MATLKPHEPILTADEALKRLIDGNLRFQRGEARFPTVRKDSLADLAQGQQPYATILGCNDSRVPPELIFDAGFGELFIVRVADNVLSAEIAGSLQYAGSHLHTPLFVVLGHSGRGAARAALETQLRGVQQRARIQLLIDNILPGLLDPDPQLSPLAQLDRAVEANVRWTLGQVLETSEAQARLAEGRMQLVGAVYEIESGGVRFLS